MERTRPRIAVRWRRGGRTVAVVGHGLAHCFPREHADLADEIAANGAVISELPYDTAPDAKNFPPRNRIIVGMSLGVLVVEAAERSGALISARLAMEYNREVFALPGRVDNPVASGTNRLIRDGHAKLVASLADLLEELGDVGKLMNPGGEEPRAVAEWPPAGATSLSQGESAILELLDGEGVAIDELCARSSLPPAGIAAALTGLQLKGLVQQRPGNVFARRRRA